jgi:hypothetical protein
MPICGEHLLDAAKLFRQVQRVQKKALQTFSHEREVV